MEAQACGAPVLASIVAPMPEVSGGAARHADPDDAPAFAAAFLDLLAGPARQDLVQAGLANGQRFGLAAMTAAYLDLLAVPAPTPTPTLQPALL